MEVLIVILLVALVAGVLFLAVRLSNGPAAPAPVVPTAPQPVDIAPIVEAVKAAIDVGAISTGVQGAVESKIHAAASAVLAQASEESRKQADEARKQAEERLVAQQRVLESETKNLLQPFEQQMSALAGAVDKLQDLSTQKFGSVDEAVKGLADQTMALRKVLANSQERGNWGERMLEDILSKAGFERGINYEKQETLVEGGRPDYSFILPPDRVLYLDSKFPIDNYLQYFEATDDMSRASYRDQFLKNVEDRVKELQKRDYVSQSNRNAIEYVLLFIPSEGVLGFIQQNKPSLIDDALSKQVVLCSPLTLYAFLGVVRQATASFHMEENAREILGLLTKFSKAWAQYVKNLTQVHDYFGKMQTKLKAVTTGNVMRSLNKPIKEIEALAKAQGVASSDDTLKEITAAFDEADKDLDAAEATDD